MLDVFQGVLSSDKSLNSKHVPHYVRWVRDCYNFFRQPQAIHLHACRWQKYPGSHQSSGRGLIPAL